LKNTNPNPKDEKPKPVIQLSKNPPKVENWDSSDDEKPQKTAPKRQNLKQ